MADFDLAQYADPSLVDAGEGEAFDDPTLAPGMNPAVDDAIMAAFPEMAEDTDRKVALVELIRLIGGAIGPDSELDEPGSGYTISG